VALCWPCSSACGCLEVMMVVVVADSGDDRRAAVKMNQHMTLFRARPADLALLKKIRQSRQQCVGK